MRLVKSELENLNERKQVFRMRSLRDTFIFEGEITVLPMKFEKQSEKKKLSFLFVLYSLFHQNNVELLR